MMHGQYSLAQLGEVNKRHVEEFGTSEEIEKLFGFGRKGIDRAAIAAMRANARARGANIPHGRLDRVPPGERLRNTAKKKIEETKQQVGEQIGQARNKLTEQAEEAAQPIRQAITGAEKVTENVRQTAQEARATAENVRQAAEQAKHTTANVNTALHTAQGTADSVGRAGRNIGFGLGAAGLGAGGAMAGYTYADSHRKGGNVERDSRGRLRLSAKGRQRVLTKRDASKELSEKETKSLAAHKKRIAGIHHNAGPQNYRPGMTISPFTHTEVRRDSTARRVLRPTAGYLLGGFAGRGLDTALTAATKGKYKKKFGRRLKGKYGRWGGRFAGTSAGFTQNVRSGDVEPFRRSTGEQPRYKVMVPTPLMLGGRGVFYAGSKPTGKE